MMLIDALVGRRCVVRGSSISNFVQRDEFSFCSLLLGTRRLIRSDEPGRGVRGLLDMDTGALSDRAGKAIRQMTAGVEADGPVLLKAAGAERIGLIRAMQTGVTLRIGIGCGTGGDLPTSAMNEALH